MDHSLLISRRSKHKYLMIKIQTNHPLHSYQSHRLTSDHKEDDDERWVLITTTRLAFQRREVGGVVGWDASEPSFAPITNLSTVVLHLHGAVWPISRLAVKGKVTEGLSSSDLHISAGMI